MKNVDKKLASDSFLNFVRENGTEDIEKWEKWLRENPQHHEHVERTRLVIKSIEFNKKSFDKEILHSQWEKLQKRIYLENYLKPKNKSTKTLWFSLGGIALGLSVCLLLWMKFFYNPMVTFETEYAERATVNLPDGSEVTLNRNSSIKFYKNWQEGSTRNVWFEGEGYFKVNPRKNSQGEASKFIVETDKLLVQVVGTEFSVNTNDRDRVILEYGIVNIQRKGDSHVYKMEPGQSAMLNAEGKLIMQEEKFKPHISWSDGKILLNDNSLGEIIKFLEDSYGLSIRCDDLSLLERKLSGRIRVDNTSDLLQVIEKVLGLVVVKKENKVKIFEIKNH